MGYCDVCYIYTILYGVFFIHYPVNYYNEFQIITYIKIENK